MSDIPAIRAAVKQATDKADQALALIQKATEVIGESAKTFSNATKTSNRPEVQTTLQLLAQAGKNAEEAAKVLGGVKQSATQFSNAL